MDVLSSSFWLSSFYWSWMYYVYIGVAFLFISLVLRFLIRRFLPSKSRFQEKMQIARGVFWFAWLFLLFAFLQHEQFYIFQAKIWFAMIVVYFVVWLGVRLWKIRR